MSGKSLQDIWNQMQAQKAAEYQSRLEQERRLYEQREKARQDYIQQIKMNEKVGPTPAAAASSAAGSGGGRRLEVPAVIEDFPEVIQQSFSIIWVDVDTDEWKIVIYNFETGILTDIYNTGLIYNSGNEWYLDRNDYTVHNKGFTTAYRSNVTNKYKIFYHNAEGTFIAVKDLDTQKDFQYTEENIIYLGNLNGVSTCYTFDGYNVRTHTFSDVDVSLVEVDDASGEDVTQDSTILIEAPNNGTYYLARPNGDLVDVTSSLGVIGTGNFVMEYSMDFIAKRNSDNSAVKMVSQTGELEAEFDLTEYTISGVGTYPYGQNSLFYNITTDFGKLFLSYQGDLNQFVFVTFSTSIAGTTIFSHNERSYYTPRPNAGNHLVIANYNSVVSDSLGYLCDNLNLYWLKQSSSSFLNYDLTSFGTVSFIDGFGDFTGDRLFTKSLNPIIMYSANSGTDDIIVGFLTDGECATQSTGIKGSSCSNIWGNIMNEHSFAVFDVGSDRIWQIYSKSTIVDETTTTSSWEYGSSGESINRFGTLCVLDSGDPSQSFIWTEEIGLAVGPTGYGDIWNGNPFAIRDYLSYSEQIITQFITGQEISSFIEGFHLLRPSGLSDRIIFPWGSTGSYTVETAQVGKDIVYFSVVEDVTLNNRILVYQKSDLSLIYDYNPGNSTFIKSIYDNRVYIVVEALPSVTFILIGHLGVETIEINATTYQYESNDAEDNDV